MSVVRLGQASARACVVLAVLLGTGGLSASSWASPVVAGPVTYAHDEDGRLSAAFDGSGAGVRYVYDTNGNMTSVRSLPATSLAVAQVLPSQGLAGTVVS